MKTVMWIVIIYVGIPFVLINTHAMLIGYSRCHGRSFFYNMYSTYKHDIFTIGGTSAKSRGTEECPKSPEEIEGQNSVFP